MSDDPYDILGLAKTASADEIKSAYRKLARSCHPDLNPDDKAAEARFKAASQAYELLKDPETRAKFDRGDIDATGAERPDRQYYRDYAEASQNPYQSGRGFEGFGDASDLFAEFMRQQGQRQGTHGGRHGGFHAPGPDRRYALEVMFMDAVKGGTTRITLPDGDTLDVKIPQGVQDGQTIRLRGKGGPGMGDGPPGDALVTLTVKAHPVFRREGNDIIITLPITFDEAILGGKVEAPTIDGPVKLSIPKGASGGQILRLRGRGVKPAGQANAGDQRVELRIVAPEKIDSELAAFMQSWRKSHPYNPREGLMP
ncbi:J domain-containing protein [Salipiger sp. 1_MG-2023]|uniref:J domain-containing protein n=1 Tax=Salipiger sp. 1_MG-2023 TaxID=3062665 RepID=UPI0026E33A4A|nr:J domain-containing protein [Salipiger sp. 1_MG-2023]MDO6586548.1 J domain-containing protein [Salipiger sp. 1_MG-2023]